MDDFVRNFFQEQGITPLLNRRGFLDGFSDVIHDYFLYKKCGYNSEFSFTDIILGTLSMDGTFEGFSEVNYKYIDLT